MASRYCPEYLVERWHRLLRRLVGRAGVLGGEMGDSEVLLCDI